MEEPKLTREDLLRIAAEVWDGSRPSTDLEKFGITLGDTVTGDAAREQLLAEIEALGDEAEDDAA